jgi:hypothetical protein
MKAKQKKQAEKILNALGRQPFYNFYVGEDCEFDKYLQNRVYDPSEKKQKETEMLERIIELFDLK